MTTTPAKPAAAPDVQLISVTFTCPPLHGVGNLATGSLKPAEPGDRFRQWSISVRGGVVLLISPRGWQQGTVRPNEPGRLWDPQGPSMIYEIPRTQCLLRWAAIDPLSAIDKSIQRYDTGPMGDPWPPADAQPTQASRRAPAPHELGDP